MNSVVDFFANLIPGSLYSASTFRADLSAGLTVAVVALPQSMAYAMIAGVNPVYGLYASIIPVVVASLMGSSKYLLRGPTNATSMVIFSSLSAVFIGGVLAIHLPETQKMTLVFALGALVGILQLSMGLAHFGSLSHFISHSVVVGFTTGAGILIGFNQFKNFLGLEFERSADFFETVVMTATHLRETRWESLAVGLATLVLITFSRKISPKIPGPLLAVVLTATGVQWLGFDQRGVTLIGDIPRSLPPFHLPLLDLRDIRSLFMPALAIAILGMVETISIAKSLASTSNDRFDGNREFIAQGVSNIAASFFSGIPVSGSFTRSALNYAAGARTRLAGVFSGVIVLLTLLVFSPLARYIPRPCLAAMLIHIAFHMIDRESLRLSFKTTRADRLVLISTLSATLILELAQAVFLGMLLSIVLFLRKVSHPQVERVVPTDRENILAPFVPGLPDCPQVAIYTIEGSLFFGAIDELEERLYSYDRSHPARTIIMVMKHVRSIDATGVHAMKRFLEKCRKSGTTILFAGLRESVLETFRKSGLMDDIGRESFLPSVTLAIRFAYEGHTDKEMCRVCDQLAFCECTGTCPHDWSRLTTV